MSSRTLSALNHQIRAELDVLHVLDVAAWACKLDDVRGDLGRVREEHVRHLEELSELVRGLGGTPAHRRDVTGVFQSFAARVGARHDASAMRAVRGAEDHAATVCESALYDELPSEVRQALGRILEEEQRRLRWMNRTIRERGWEETPPPWPVT